jgi:hypothetical protein
MISLFAITLQAALSVALILALRAVRIPPGLIEALDLRTDRLPESFAAAGPAMALMLALGISSVIKARLLSSLLGAPVQGWRWPIVWAAAAAVLVGIAFTQLPQHLEWLELAVGIPAILAAFGFIVWKRGFTQEDRVLFRMRKREEVEATLPPPPGASPPGR